MITVALSTRIAATANDVWRALTDPKEREIWDERILGEVRLSRPAARSRSDVTRSAGAAPRSRTRWRFALAGIQQVLQDDIVSEDRLERVVSRLAIGSMHFDQTLTFHAEDDETGPHTRLGMKLTSHNQVAVIGEFIQRGRVQEIVLEYVDTTLRQVQKHCER